MQWLRFRHPEPKRIPRRIIPVFLPYHGCPGRCIYCAQHLQTGAGRPRLTDIHQHLCRDLENRALSGQRSLGIAFFGGTFTALSHAWQRKFLELAGHYREKGVIDHVRCSTRPDRVSPDHLAWLKTKGLDMVELGVQSFDDEVLQRSQRGYAGHTARWACIQVRQGGLELGIQLMPGLPGATMRSWENDLEQTRALEPHAVRIYPCLVLRGTPLAETFHHGEFRPWGLDRTVWAAGLALLSLWKADIPVIRLGLAPQQDLCSGVVAGPWHPALGQLARSVALRSHILKALSVLPKSDMVSLNRHIFIPRRHASDFWGHRRNMARAWQRAGFPRDRVHAWEKPFFWIVWESQDMTADECRAKLRINLG